MATPTTGRQDVVAALLSVLTTYKSANPTKLRRIFTARPGGPPGEVPFAYIGHRDEAIIHTEGTRQRTFTPTVTVCDHLGDNEQSAGRMDVLVDALVDAFTAGVNVIAGAVLVQTGVRDGEESFAGTAESVVSYLSATFDFDEITLMEGRT